MRRSVYMLGENRFIIATGLSHIPCVVAMLNVMMCRLRP